VTKNTKVLQKTVAPVLTCEFIKATDNAAATSAEIKSVIILGDLCA